MKLTWNKGLAVFWLVLVVASTSFAPAISPYSPQSVVEDALQPPNQQHPLGTDALGRDLASRLLHGGRVTILASLSATAITILLGGISGTLAAVLGGWFDRITMWLVNVLLAIPGLLLAMLLVAVFGPGLTAVVLAVGFSGAPTFARLARSISLQILEQGFIRAATALGAGRRWILIQHVLPNGLGPLISVSTTHYAWALLGTTTLTFLGLAGDPSLPEWGSMLDSSRAYLVESPWGAFWPGLAITVTILSVHSIGDWLTQRGDPRMQPGRPV